VFDHTSRSLFMNAIRIVTLNDEEGNQYRIILPEGARVEGEGDATTIRLDPGDDYRAFADDDGMIEMSPAAIVQFARDGIDGFALVRPISP
jgi:hypothetical protein